MTLYDTLNKIPLFSAAKYRGCRDGRPEAHWKIEPQVAFTKIQNLNNAIVLLYFNNIYLLQWILLSHYVDIKSTAHSATYSTKQFLLIQLSDL